MKTIEEIKEKLKKLLAMAEDGNGACQSEVESALKVARKLMAEYKLSERDIKDIEHSEVIKLKLDNISFSTIVNPWVLTLLNIVADNYCCHPVIYTAPNAKTKNAGLIGFEEDVEIAKTVLTYAFESILSGFKDVEKKNDKKARLESYYNNIPYRPLTSAEKTSARNAYGNGFVSGIKEAFEEQNKVEKETGFALVMTVPQEVEEVANGLTKSSFNTSSATRKARMFDNYAVNGYYNGKEFNINRRLA